MGRRRKHNTHLPRGMTLEHGAYYLRPNARTRTPLGRDFAAAMTRYGELVSGQWAGRTLGDVIDRYRLEVLPLKAANTQANEGRALDMLRKVFGRMLPDQLTPRDCYRYVDLRRTKDGKPAPIAARNEIKLLQHVYSKAIRWGVTSLNPARGVELPKAQRGDRYVTDAELEAVRGMASDRVRVAIDLAHLIGARRGDVLALTRDDVTDEGLRLRAAKTGKADTFAWTPALREVVERARRIPPQLPGRNLVRNRAGQAYTGSGFNAVWKSLMKRYEKAGGRRFKFHDIRAKTGSDSGTLAEAAERLQHSSPAVTQAHYRRKGALLRPLK